jgi:hypothetical protein
MINELKLEKYCGHLPWVTRDPKKLGGVISNFVEKNDRFMGPWYERWFTNFQFIYGNHRFQWSQKYGFPLDVDFLSRGNKSINSRSQTDISRTIFESLVSSLFGNAPDWEAIAMDDNAARNRRFKEISEKALAAFYEKLLMEKEVKGFVQNLVAYGLSTFKTDFDLTSGQIEEIPQYEQREVTIHETVAQSADPLGLINSIVEANNSEGMPLTQTRVVPALDENGKPRVNRRWMGQPRVRTRTPFEHRRELCSGGAQHARWHQDIRIMEFSEFLEEYKDMDGRTEFFDKVRPGLIHEAATSFAIRHFMRMNFLTPQNDMAYWFRAETALSQDFLKTKVMVIEHYDKPNIQHWPEGRLVVVVNGYCTHITKPQYRTNKIDGWHPFSEAMWMNINPSPMPSGPMDGVTRKNKELDDADSLIDTMMRRNMGAMILYKTGNGFDTQAVFGEPGQLIDVNDINGVRILKDDQPIPPVLDKLREMKKQDAYETSGAGDSLRGERPAGVEAGYAFRLLEEREQKRITHVRRALEGAVGSAGEKLLSCVRAMGKGFGPDIIGYMMRNSAGGFSASDIKAFIDMPLSFGVDVIIRPGSMQAKSKATAQATYLDLINKSPIIAQRLQDADVLDRFLQEFDADVLRDRSSVHRDRAKKENDVLIDISQQGPDVLLPLPVVCENDNHVIHLDEHEAEYVRRFDEFQTDEFALQVWNLHMEMHRFYEKQQKGEIPPGTMHNFRQLTKVAGANLPDDLNTNLQKGAALQQTRQMEAQASKPQGAPGAPGGQPPPGAPPTQGPGAQRGESVARDTGMGMQ